jgi:hypothetical protein
MRPPRQTHLDFSTANSLTLVYPAARRAASPQRPPGENLLFQLPDELLVSIVEFAAHRPHFAHNPCGGCNGDIGPSWNPRVLKALSRVCHRLRRLAQPLLFHTILFSYPHSIVPPTKLAGRLHHVLKKNPELRQHCRYGEWPRRHPAHYTQC